MITGAFFVLLMGLSLAMVPVMMFPIFKKQNEVWQDCQYLSEDGLTIASASQDIWRLTTVEEAVRSMARHGENSGGAWNAEMMQATYITTQTKSRHFGMCIRR